MMSVSCRFAAALGQVVDSTRSIVLESLTEPVRQSGLVLGTAGIL
jgi:hypothetical protein